MRRTLYERRKGRQMHVSGTWALSSAERKLINGVAVFFAISVIAVLISAFVQERMFLTVSIICCVISFILMFVALFGLIFKKSREQPVETHYYDVDYRDNRITGETEDKIVEISKDEFMHGNRR